MMICVFPFVCFANASAIPWPIPEAPPTKRATGVYVGLKAALAVCMDARDGILESDKIK